MATSSAAFLPANLRTGNVGNASTNSSGAIDPQKTLANRLADKLGLKPGDLDAKASNFTPDKVSERILGFVGGALKSKAADGADTAELQDMLAKMRKGVEEGFAEAKKILDGLGVLGGKVAADIEETFNKITAGLDKLGEALGVPPKDGGSGEPTSITGDYSDRNYQAQAQSFNLDLTTLDGDKVRITAANASSSESSKAADGSSSTKTMQVAGYSVEVDGELSDEEMASLKDLFSKVSDISDKFYSGDLQGAFDQAVKLDINGTQLASLSLNMTTASVRATETYGAVAGGKAGASNSALQDYAKSLVDGLQTASGLSDDPARTMSNLLKGAFSLDDRFDQDDLNKAQTLNDRLLDGLKGLVSPPVATASKAAPAASDV